MSPTPPRLRHPRELTRGDELWVISGLIVAAAVLLVATLPGIDMGGDAAWKWAFVRSWGHGLPWVYDHHTARFAVNVPVYLSQRVLGTHVNVMYVAPVAFALLQIALVYQCGRRLCSRGVGLGAVALLLAFEPWAMAASRLLPGVFQTTYLTLALFCYLQFARSTQRHWLFGLGLSLLLAYEAMITSLYFVPGFVLAVWWLRRRFSDNVWWLIVLCLGIALETALYAWLSDFPRGQLQIAGRTHHNVVPIGFWGLFQRYLVLPQSWQLALGLGGLGAALLPWLTRARPIHGLCMLIGTIVVAMTFGVKQLSPLVPALNFRARYFDPLAPLLALAIAACIRAACQAFFARKRRRARSVGAWWTQRRMLVLACAALICEAGLLVRLRGVTGFEQLALNAHQQRTLSEAYLEGTSIVGRNARDHDQIKTLVVVAFGFLSDAAFWSQPDVRKPLFSRIRVGHRSHRVMARVDTERKRIEHEVAQKRCVVFVARLSPDQGLRVQVADRTGCSAGMTDAALRPF